MFPGFSEDTVRFLIDLRFHNEVSFMHEHRDEYRRDVQEPFFALIDELAPVMRKIDPEMETRPQKCLSRIHRDTRFSQDKSPYRDHHWIAFRKSLMGKDGQPFYWFEFGPDRLSWGLGVWGENKDLMNALRQRILSDPETVTAALAQAQKHRFSPDGDIYQRYKIPPEVPEPLRGLYRAKDLYFSRANPRYEWAFSPELSSRVARDFRALSPVWQLLSDAARDATRVTPGEKPVLRQMEDIWN